MDKKPDKKRNKIILVDWLDSVGDPGWKLSEECKSHLLVCQTVGFLVEETEDALCLALSRTTRDGYRPYTDLISIPKVAIKKFKRIKEA